MCRYRLPVALAVILLVEFKRFNSDTHNMLTCWLYAIRFRHTVLIAFSFPENK